MTHDARKLMKVARWLGPVCARMHVGHDVRLASEPCDDGAHATIQRDGMGFVLHIEGAFFTRAPSLQRAVLVHELAHTYFDDMDAAHDAMLDKVLSPVDLDRVQRLRGNAEHAAIEKITRAIAPHMPLPRF